MWDAGAITGSLWVLGEAPTACCSYTGQAAPAGPAWSVKGLAVCWTGFSHTSLNSGPLENRDGDINATLPSTLPKEGQALRSQPPPTLAALAFFWKLHVPVR